LSLYLREKKEKKRNSSYGVPFWEDSSFGGHQKNGVVVDLSQKELIYSNIKRRCPTHQPW
jgi:hypothetical protein